MTDTPSKQAIQYACELANAREPEIGLVWTPEDINCSTLRALALHLDEVDRAAREIEAALDNVKCQSGHKSARAGLRSIMLPDPVDPLEEAVEALKDGRAGQHSKSYAACLRAELDKRGLTIAPKEQGRLTGEWFNPHPDILAEIERLNATHPKEP